MCYAMVSVAAAGVGGIAAAVLLLHLPAVLCRKHGACPDTFSRGEKAGRASASWLGRWQKFSESVHRLVSMPHDDNRNV